MTLKRFTSDVAAQMGIFILSCVVFLWGAEAEATPLNRWSIECSVDNGSIVKRGNTRVFRPSSNQCVGGVFNQRAEIGSKRVKPSHTGTYLFSSMISMTNDRNEKFTIFQIADGRNGCAPPLSVNIRRDGGVKLRADYKTGPAESCVRDVLRHKTTPVRFTCNGRPQKLDVLIDFLGDGSFDVQL
ncbi:hypothetical protein MACH17_01410 [Phaeobacter inhibens]|nr:hypothetical protein MACH17_01410 [Phaeobacter inhibens]